MNKALAGLFISVGFLLPVLASAHSTPKPPKDTIAPTVTTVRIVSSNAVSTKAVAGDTVTLTFTTSEKVQTPVVLVNSRPVILRATNSSANNWVASYKVTTKDPSGKAQYAIAIADMANNVYACTSIKTILQMIIKYCPPTDGSSVTVSKPVPPMPGDTKAPVIAAHANVYATTTGTTATVTYATPTAVDNVDGAVAVTCSPASGFVFAVGTTTVTCSAEDAAGNDATSSFEVVVTKEAPSEPSGPYTMASQPDESYLCGVTTNSWRYCDDEVTFSFTDGVGDGTKTIDLGPGSDMGEGTIDTVVISGKMDVFHPWLITINCFTDSSYTDACSDWASISDAANDIRDSKYWTADFSSENRTFTPAYFYQMTIYDTEWDRPAYGSLTLKEPYWKIVGVR